MAVSPQLAQAILGLQAPDVVGAFREGQERQKQQKIDALTGEILAGGGNFAELSKIDPRVAFELQNALMTRDAAETEAFIRDARFVEHALKTNPADAKSYLTQRHNILKQGGRNTTQNDEILRKVEAGDISGALQSVQKFTQSIDQAQGATSQTRTRQALLQDLKSDDPRVVESAEIELGLKGRAAAALTPEQIEARERAKGTAKSSIAAADKAFERMPAVARAISNIDAAIQAIDEGATTGVIRSKLPSVKAASVRLDQLRNELGLDVVGSATFGALSESELALALDTALPTKLSPPELRKFLVEKKAAQEKLRAGLEEAIIFLQGGGTISELVAQRRTEREAPAAEPQEAAASPTAPSESVAAPQQATQILRFDAQGNIIQ